jgi:hypothetical protein
MKFLSKIFGGNDWKETSYINYPNLEKSKIPTTDEFRVLSEEGVKWMENRKERYIASYLDDTVSQMETSASSGDYSRLVFIPRGYVHFIYQEFVTAGYKVELIRNEEFSTRGIISHSPDCKGMDALDISWELTK